MSIFIYLYVCKYTNQGNDKSPICRTVEENFVLFLKVYIYISHYFKINNK